MSPGLGRGDVVWTQFDPTMGREQRGQRPALVVASDDYLASVHELVIVVPLTTVDRRWPHHVPVGGATGLSRPSFAMTEQPRTLAMSRIGRRLGAADKATLDSVDTWLRDFIGL